MKNLMLLIAVLALVGCKKDDPVEPTPEATPTLIGLWNVVEVDGVSGSDGFYDSQIRFMSPDSCSYTNLDDDSGWSTEVLNDGTTVLTLSSRFYREDDTTTFWTRTNRFNINSLSGNSCELFLFWSLLSSDSTGLSAPNKLIQLERN